MGCPEDPEPPPSFEPLDPVVRTAALHWVLSDPVAGSVEAVAAALPSYRPTGVFLSGDLAPTLATGGEDAVVLDAIAQLEAAITGAGATAILGFDVAALPSDLQGEICFQPSEPLLVARRDALDELLRAHPLATRAAIDFSRSPTPFEIPCTCPACEGEGADGLASRLDALFRAYEPATPIGGVLWWGARLPWPDPDPATSAQAMDLALTVRRPDPQLAVRSAGFRGPEHIWAIDDPQLDAGTERRTAADLDLVGAAFGPTRALVLLPDDLHDRMRRHRSRNVVAWFVHLDGAGKRVLGSAEELMLFAADRFFRDFSADPESTIEEWVELRYGLTRDETPNAALSAALRRSGEALSMASHVLGIAPAGLADGMPTALPVERIDPSPWSDAWAGRWQELQAPTTATLVAVNQWSAESIARAEDVVANIENAAPDLAPNDAAELRERAATLALATSAWALVNRADVTLAAWQSSADADVAGWLLGDADDLDGLAAEAEAALAAGTVDSLFPVAPAGLRAIAAQVRAAVGPGEAGVRPFPVIHTVRHDFTNDRTNYYWAIEPPGSGWVERGGSWPTYTDTSELGAGPATWWHAWSTSVPADARITYRACGVAAGFTVCSADHALWTRP